MAQKSFTSNSSLGSYLKLTLSESISSVDNTSNITWTLEAITSRASFKCAATTVVINGTQVCSYSAVTAEDNQFPGISGSVSGTMVIPHNSDGTKTISITFTTGVYSDTTTDYGGTMTLWNIDRTAPSVTINVSNITATGFRVTASADANCDTWKYSVDGGAMVTFSTSVSKSQYVDISSLTPNANHTIQVTARKDENEIYGTSTTKTVKTLGSSQLNTVSAVTADNSTVTIALNATVYVAGYTHDLVVKNQSTTILTLSGVSITSGANSITLNASQRSTLLSAMASIKYFTGTFELITYNSGVQVGSSSTATAIVTTTEANSAPVFSSFTYSDTNASTVAVTGDDQLLIQGLSYLEIVATAATALNGASIVSYSATAGNISAASATTNIDLGEIPDNGTVQLVVTAIDSRGYTSSVSVSITVYEYVDINISAYSCRRENEAEDNIQAIIEGTKQAVEISGTDRNTFQSLQYRYKKTDDVSWSAWVDVTSSVTATDQTFDFVDNYLISLDANYSWYIEFEVSDQLTSDSVILTVPQGIPLMSFRKKKVGINNRNPASALDVNGTIRMNGLNVHGLISALGDSEDLNDIKDPGIYPQTNATDADTSRHYPAAKAGMLEVLASSDGCVVQRYTVLDCTVIYCRAYNSTWTNWKSLNLN